MPARRLNRIQDLEILKKFNSGKTLTELKREYGYTNTKSIKTAIWRANNNIDDKYLGWSKERVFEYAKNLIEKHGKLPSAKWLVKNKETGFDTAVKKHYGGYVKLRKDLGEDFLRLPWDRQRVIDTAKELIKKYSDLPTQDWLNENGYKDFVGGAFRNYEGGITQLRFDLDLQFGKGTILWNQKLINLYAERLVEDLGDIPHPTALINDGHNGFYQALNKHYAGGYEQLREDLKLPFLTKTHGGDTIQEAIEGNLYKNDLETDLYAYKLKNFKGYQKVGIATRHELRAKKDSEYGELIAVWQRPSRTDALFLECAILDQTRTYEEAPLKLLEDNWHGYTEIRKIDPDYLIENIQFFVDLINDLGAWQFALNHLNLNLKQIEKIKQKITTKSN